VSQTPAIPRSSRSVTDPHELLQKLPLLREVDGVVTASQRFALKLSAHVAQRLEGRLPDDPLVRQFVPSSQELLEREGYVADPVSDGSVFVVPGLLKKYNGRALVITTAACPVHCRYCFRREFPYNEASAIDHWDDVHAAITADASIAEVILSGGDPLSLSNTVLERMVRSLEGIVHVRRLRVHTRVPTTSPLRIDDGLLTLLSTTRFGPVVMVLHVNHADEIDDTVGVALAKLRAKGVVLLSQSVLLRGVNDSVEALESLSERLVMFGVMPYYLHVLDRVRGSAHFEVPDEEACALVDALRDRVPGYMVPRLVREVPGKRSKTPVRG
jgi:L-lysine 2,3-aminomutase